MMKRMYQIMNDDFCAFILTHGRPDRVITWDSLLKAGYTGKVYIVIDDEDKTAVQYRERFGDLVLQFCKSDIAKAFDEGDNFGDRRAIVYARNACWDLAGQVGCKYFIQLDDDYTSFVYRFSSDARFIHVKITDLDAVFAEYLELLIRSRAATVALAQGGDFILGETKNATSVNQWRQGKKNRKAMNTFFCDRDNRFWFSGRINEDVNTYVSLGRTGILFLTHPAAAINQLQTQSNPGGMTDLYADSGTYVKSFYSVMYAPSCVKIAPTVSLHPRLHHKINWNATVPKILRETHRKPCPA